MKIDYKRLNEVLKNNFNTGRNSGKTFAMCYQMVEKMKQIDECRIALFCTHNFQREIFITILDLVKEIIPTFECGVQTKSELYIYKKFNFFEKILKFFGYKKKNIYHRIYVYHSTKNLQRINKGKRFHAIFMDHWFSDSLTYKENEEIKEGFKYCMIT